MSDMNQDDILAVTLVPSKVLKAMVLADAVRDSMMIWGAPGIGKSAIAREYADENYPLRKNSEKKLAYMKLCAADPDHTMTEADVAAFEAKLLDQETNFIDFRLSQIDPSDLRGVPIPERIFRDLNSGKVLTESERQTAQHYIAETVVVWAAPKLLKLPANWKGVILFDEINSAMPIVQAASYQLILDRCVGEMKLPDDAFVLAAGNRETDGGVTFQLATPLRDRMTHVEMVADYQDWIDNFALPNRVDPMVIAFIANTGKRYFNTLSPTDPSHSGGTSPRSWTRISDFEKARRGGISVENEVYNAMVSGRIGEGNAMAYLEYANNVAGLPETMAILRGEVKELDKKADISQKYFIVVNLVSKIIDLYEGKMDKKLDVKDWTVYCTNFIQFLDHNFSATNGELSILAMRTITMNEVLISYTEVPAFKPFVTRYSALVKKARGVV